MALKCLNSRIILFYATIDLSKNFISLVLFFTAAGQTCGTFFLERGFVRPAGCLCMNRGNMQKQD